MNRFEIWKRDYLKIVKFQEEFNLEAPQGVVDLTRWFRENARRYRKNKFSRERKELWEKLKFKQATPNEQLLFNFFKARVEVIRQYQEETGKWCPRVSENEELYRYWWYYYNQAKNGTMPAEHLEIWKQLKVKYPGRTRTPKAEMKKITIKYNRADN